MRNLTASDPTFLDEARHRVEVRHVVDAPSSDVWACLADHANWNDWYPEMTDCSSAEPGRLGAERSITLGPLRAVERWVIWEPPERLGFTVVHTNLPLAKRVIEVLTITPDTSDDTRTVIDYTGCFQPTLLARLVAGRTKRQMSTSWSVAFSSLSDHLSH
jgi:Polyketide cyclase / dehydrase and lipid transport